MSARNNNTNKYPDRYYVLHEIPSALKVTENYYENPFSKFKDHFSKPEISESDKNRWAELWKAKRKDIVASITEFETVKNETIRLVDDFHGFFISALSKKISLVQKDYLRRHWFEPGREDPMIEVPEFPCDMAFEVMEMVIDDLYGKIDLLDFKNLDSYQINMEVDPVSLAKHYCEKTAAIRKELEMFKNKCDSVIDLMDPHGKLNFFPEVDPKYTQEWNEIKRKCSLYLDRYTKVVSMKMEILTLTYRMDEIQMTIKIYFCRVRFFLSNKIPDVDPVCLDRRAVENHFEEPYNKIYPTLVELRQELLGMEKQLIDLIAKKIAKFDFDVPDVPTPTLHEMDLKLNAINSRVLNYVKKFEAIDNDFFDKFPV